MAFARPGAAGCLAAGEMDGWGCLSPPRSSSPVERGLPTHLRRAAAGSGRNPLRVASTPFDFALRFDEPGDLDPMGSKGNSCYLLGGAGDKDDPSPP